MSSKICKGCGVEKELSEFYVARRNLDGRIGKCKLYVKVNARENRRNSPEQYARYERSRANLPHRLEARQKYQQEHRDRLSEYKKRWTEDNAERVTASKRDHYERNRAEVISRSREWAENNPDKVKTAKPTIAVSGEPRSTPVVETSPLRSSKCFARGTVIGVYVAVTRKLYWRPTTSCL